MSGWKYDSGGHQKDHKAYRENWEKIFGKKKEAVKDEEHPHCGTSKCCGKCETAKKL